MLSLPNSVEGKGSCWELAGHGSIQTPPGWWEANKGVQSVGQARLLSPEHHPA